MPERSVIKRAKQDLQEGKSASTAAGEFVREEIHHIREGKHGARSPKQAIAIGLSEARQAGVPLEPPKKGVTSERTRHSAERAYEAGQSGKSNHASPSRRGRATKRALAKEPTGTVSKAALSRNAKAAAATRKRRTATQPSGRASTQSKNPGAHSTNKRASTRRDASDEQ